MILLKPSRNIKEINKIKSVWKMLFLIDIHTVELSLVHLHIRMNEQLY